MSKFIFGVLFAALAAYVIYDLFFQTEQFQQITDEELFGVEDAKDDSALIDLTKAFTEAQLKALEVDRVVLEEIRQRKKQGNVAKLEEYKSMSVDSIYKKMPEQRRQFLLTYDSYQKVESVFLDSIRRSITAEVLDSLNINKVGP